MNEMETYSNFIKPFFAPPAFLFAPVWTFLYIIIAISFGYVFYSFFRKKISSEIALPFFLNLVFNFIYTPIQFGLQNNLLATVDIILVLFTLAWAMKKIFGKIKWVAYINIPYFLWVSFATILQITITYLNY
jgi:tryptophan-rich sensory protein